MSEEKGLEGDLEDGDGINWVASEGFGEVRQRAVGGTACGGLGAIEFWRRADSGQCGPNGGLCFLESFPNSIGSGIAHAAIEMAHPRFRVDDLSSVLTSVSKSAVPRWPAL